MRCGRDGGEAVVEGAGCRQLAAPEVPGFVVREPLGAGGFAAVWTATRIGDDVEIALKLARSADRLTAERFRREADVLEKVGPPGVPQLIAHGALPDGRPFLAMERLRAKTLAAWLEDLVEPPELRAVATIAAKILTGLEAVHAHGFVHADLKPENILLCPGEPMRIALLDFGLARRLGPSRDATISSAAAGSLFYMAPEQFLGTAPPDPRQDVYAFAVVLYEILTLCPPFAGDAAAIEFGHRYRRPPRPSTLVPLPAAVEAAVLKGLAKRPDERYQQAADFRESLREAFALTESSGIRTGEQQLRAPSAAAASARRPIALLFLRADEANRAQIQSLIEPAGGTFAHAAEDQHAVVFGAEAGENPLKRALVIAERMVAQDLCTRVIIDQAEVTVRRRQDGSSWYLSPLFRQNEHYPAESDPPGVLLSATTAGLIKDRRIVPAGRLWTLRPWEPRDLDLTAATSPGEPVFLVGREDELGTLLDDVRRALSARLPTLATILGDSGFGKSLLGASLIERVRRELPGCRIMELRAPEPVGGEVTPVLRELLQRIFALPTRAPLASGRALIVELLGRDLANEVWTGVALMLGWVDVSATEVRGLAAGPGVLRRTAVRAVGEGLRALTRTAPLLVVLDDAHWVDDGALDALEYATRAETGAPLCCLAFGRPRFAETRPDWGQRAGARREVCLGPLARGDAASLCRRLLLPAEDVPQAVVDRLIDRAQAVPMLIVELVRGLVQRGLLRRQREGAGWFVATDDLDKVPDLPLVQWLAGRELDALPPELGAHARLVSLLEGEFTVEAVTGILARLDAEGHADAFPLDGRLGVERLVDARLLRSHRNGTVTFRHALLRDAVAATVPESSSRHIHRAAYLYYRDTHGIPEPVRRPRLAHHAAQHGAREEALAAYVALANDARGRHAYVEAESMFSRVIELATESDVERRLWAHHGRGVMRYRVGRHEDSLGDFAVAGELARRTGDRRAEIDLLLDEAMALDWLEKWRRSRELAEAAQALLPGVASPALEARVVMSLGRSALRFGRSAECAELLERAAALARPGGGETYETLVVSLLMLGVMQAWLGRPDDSQATFEQVVALCREHRDELHLAAALGNRVHLWMARRDRPRMLADLTECIDLGRKMANTGVEHDAHWTMAEILYWMGELEEARRHLERVLALDERRHGRAARPSGLLLKARLLLASGDAVQARAALDAIATQQEWARGEGLVESLLVPAEEVLYDMARLAAAGDDDARWDELTERARRDSVQQELIEVLEVRGRAARQAGDVDAARAAWRAALEVAERVPNVMRERIERLLAQLPPQG